MQFESIRNLLHSKEVYDIAAAYLGGVPKIHEVDLLYSPETVGYRGSQLFHLDNIAVKALRMIIAVDPISENNGPFTVFDLESTSEIVQQLN